MKIKYLLEEEVRSVIVIIMAILNTVVDGDAIKYVIIAAVLYFIYRAHKYSFFALIVNRKLFIYIIFIFFFYVIILYFFSAEYRSNIIWIVASFMITVYVLSGNFADGIFLLLNRFKFHRALIIYTIFLHMFSYIDKYALFVKYTKVKEKIGLRKLYKMIKIWIVSIVPIIVTVTTEAIFHNEELFKIRGRK